MRGPGLTDNRKGVLPRNQDKLACILGKAKGRVQRWGWQETRKPACTVDLWTPIPPDGPQSAAPTAPSPLDYPHSRPIAPWQPFPRCTVKHIGADH